MWKSDRGEPDTDKRKLKAFRSQPPLYLFILGSNLITCLICSQDNKNSDDGRVSVDVITIFQSSCFPRLQHLFLSLHNHYNLTPRSAGNHPGSLFLTDPRRCGQRHRRSKIS